MERKRKASKVSYFAVDKDGNKFPVFYGKNMGDVFVSDDIEKVAHNIAYYCHRCYAELIADVGGRTRKATKREREKFDGFLRSEFFYYENR